MDLTNKINNNTLKLVKPSIEYKDSFIKAMKEFKLEGLSHNISEGNITKNKIKELEGHFEEFLNELDNREKGVNLPEGYVPSSTFWLIDDGEYIGRVSIRHKLTDELTRHGGNIGYAIRLSQRGLGYGNEILKLGLIKAKELGLKKVLLTCDDDNIRSSKVIEKNYGILENKIKDENKLVRRYWILIGQ
jgi:predicted acetyltransferase